MTSASPAKPRAAHGRRPRRPRTTVLGVIGELFITAGVVLLLFVAWQLWIGDMIYGAERNEQGAALSQEWAEQAEQEPTEPSDEPDPIAEGDIPADWEPPHMDVPVDGERFGVMRVPRWGDDYVMPMAGGITKPITLDPIGIGHYSDTEMPGEVGNFALAGHRTTFGKPFNQIAELQVGDAIVVETQDGWYTYRFRTLEYVTPDQTDVLLDVPQKPDVPAGGRYITLTACSPMYSLAERIVAYGVLESFQERADGEPDSLTEGVS
ncbi:class E sortase [Microbacterium halophytorum]|uniref:class E sortase n=1 Tax=Microbacterium halophytorum TaxID=2067568 RepID=UPI000CFB7BB7|nr:class E sortase [Microbacterium halophytorum]